MTIKAVFEVMEYGKPYLPEEIPCELKRATVSSYLRSLWRGGCCDRKQIEVEEDGRKKKRLVYISRQRRLDLG